MDGSFKHRCFDCNSRMIMVGEETAFCDDCGAEYDVEIEDGDVRLYPEGEDKPVMKLRQQEALERLRRFANKE